MVEDGQSHLILFKCPQNINPNRSPLQDAPSSIYQVRWGGGGAGSKVSINVLQILANGELLFWQAPEGNLCKVSVPDPVLKISSKETKFYALTGQYTFTSTIS